MTWKCYHDLTLSTINFIDLPEEEQVDKNDENTDQSYGRLYLAVMFAFFVH